jgi:signal transduction histidine kinase
MLSRLEGSRRTQERLVSDAAHELRNPIAAIRQYAEVALAHPEKTDTSSLAEDVLTEDLRLQNLAEDLLFLARADEHTFEVHAVGVDMDDIVLEEAERLKKTTDLRIDTSAVSAGRSKGDRTQLQRAIRNLADNAARHASSTVRFSVSEQDEQISIVVDDDGTGIPPEAREAVFERFTRLDTARDRTQGGAGLGLAIVTEIVSAHGGSTIVGDAPLGGARFQVVLPRSAA